MKRAKEPSQEEMYGHHEGLVSEEIFNEMKIIETTRPNGTKRVQFDYTNCPTLTEQHTAHLTNINYLIEKYKPDELAAYIAARNQHRTEILGHDFSREPSKQDALNVVVESRKNFEALPDEVRSKFRNHLEFLKFIDIPANVEKLVKTGVLKKREVESIRIKDPTEQAATQTKTKDEAKEQ